VARIVLIGPGAIGGTVAGGLLAGGRHQLTICANQRFDTLEVKRAQGGDAASYPVRVVTSADDVAPADWVLLAVKSHQTASAAEWLKATVGFGTKVAVLQNGVEHRERVAPLVPNDTAIVPIVVQLPAQRTAPGRITTYGGSLLIAPNDADGREFGALFDGTPVKITLTDDFATAQWEKLCLNASSGSLTALASDPDAINRVPALRNVAKAIIEECVAVGRAEGATFAAGYADTLADMLASRKGNRGNSMYYDRIEGKEMEYDARNAVICRLGRKHGIATPVSDTIVPLLAAVSGRT
jgi:2-dehydropantoate 2-reductase